MSSAETASPGYVLRHSTCLSRHRAIDHVTALTGFDAELESLSLTLLITSSSQPAGQLARGSLRIGVTALERTGMMPRHEHPGTDITVRRPSAHGDSVTHATFSVVASQRPLDPSATRPSRPRTAAVARFPPAPHYSHETTTRARRPSQIAWDRV